MTAAPARAVATAEVADAFLATSVRALRADGAAALDSLGWWDTLEHVGDDIDLRAAALALFRAQGRTATSTAALGALLAQPHLAGTGIRGGEVLSTVQRTSLRSGEAHLVVGDSTGRRLLVDRPGEGVVLVDPDHVELVPTPTPCGVELHTVADLGRRATRLVAEADAGPARARSAALGRLALGLEMLGAAEATVDLAVEHAKAREQFGEPIGRFQAIRHLLAWAQTDCVAIESVARQALRFGDRPPARFDEVVKALAGRNARRACERTLQVLGGVGFTAEHDHHLHHGRVLLDDALLGSSAALTAGLGAWAREGGADPGYAAAVLHHPSG